MEVTKVPKKIVTVIEPKRSMTVDKEKYRQKRVAAYCRVSTDSEEQLVSYRRLRDQPSFSLSLFLARMFFWIASRSATFCSVGHSNPEICEWIICAWAVATRLASSSCPCLEFGK